MKRFFEQPTFLINEEDVEGYFEWGHARQPLFDRFYEACELLDVGDTKKAIGVFKDIIKKDHWFIDAYVSLAAIQSEKDNYYGVLKYLEKPVELFELLIPKTFDGKIVWSIISNRPFLRALCTLGLAYLRVRNYGASANCFQKLLLYNPNDNQGIRHLIGNVYLYLGKNELAEKYLSASLEEYPPNLYSYAICLFLQGKKIKAITYFRRGFINNIYVAEYLAGKSIILKYSIIHESNYNEPDVARDYSLDCLDLWVLRYSKAHKFFLKLFNSQLIADEVSNILGYDHFILTRTYSEEYRKEMLSRRNKLILGINDVSSKEIAKKLKL
ncbi:hypothetical protein JNL27_02050 [bacterium]|nr:hypothetical protein [bacterium]